MVTHRGNFSATLQDGFLFDQRGMYQARCSRWKPLIAKSCTQPAQRFVDRAEAVLCSSRLVALALSAPAALMPWGTGPCSNSTKMGVAEIGGRRAQSGAFSRRRSLDAHDRWKLGQPLPADQSQMCASRNHLYEKVGFT